VRRETSHIFAFPEITPIVNIALVVLIIFMITIPAIREGIPVETPKARHSETPEDVEREVVVSIRTDGSLYVNLKKVSWRSLRDELTLAYRGREGTPIVIKGAKTLKYGEILRIMEVCREVGAPGVHLVARKEE